MNLLSLGCWMRTTAIVGFFGVSVSGSAALALGLSDLSNQDASQGLKEALVQSSGRAVGALGRVDGFLGNPKVKIPLPAGLARVESGMRMVGMGRYADELVTTMNRAAEAAVPEAKTLLVDAVKKMSVQDAKGILTGGEDAATRYFRKTTSEPLMQRFMPIVKKATAKLQLADTYNNFAGKAASFGVIGKNDADLDTYVARKALDGLFLMMAEEEKAIRQNPLGAATNIVKKVFGAIGN